jgi:hypothetical protein
MHVRICGFFFYEESFCRYMMILKKIMESTHEQTDGPSGPGRESLLGTGSPGPDENPT